MRYFRISIIALCALVCGSCGPRSANVVVASGCYYYGAEPVLKIAGHRGVMLLRGDVRNFHIDALGDQNEARVTFSPGFMLYDGMTTLGPENFYFDFEPRKSHVFTVKSVSTSPTIPVKWVAEPRQENLHLGKPC